MFEEITNTTEKSTTNNDIDIVKENQTDERNSIQDECVNLSPVLIQRKLYFLVDQLKEMHAKLPVSFQIRISYDLLTMLANCLLNNTIFEIVKGLMEIQHVTEKHLQQLRDQVENEYQIEVQEWVSNITDQEELDHILKLMKKKHEKKLRETDMKLISTLDHKVQDQQSTLQKAGVPGFYLTDNPKEIKVQMFLLDFILRLSVLKFDPNK